MPEFTMPDADTLAELRDTCESLLGAGRRDEAIAYAEQKAEQMPCGSRSMVLAWLYERCEREREAYELYGAALRVWGQHDFSLAHARRGAFEAKNGWVCSALRSTRHALFATKRTASQGTGRSSLP